MKTIYSKIKSLVLSPLSIALIISAIVYNKWFSFGIFQKSDWTFRFAENLQEESWASVWLAGQAFGSFDLTFWRLPLYLLYGFFGNIGFNSSFADFFIVFIPIIFLLPLSGYLLAKEFTNSKIAALSASIILSFNTYFFAISTQGHILINAAVPFIVFSLIFFIRALKNGRKTNYILFTLFLLLSSFYDLRVSYLTVIIFFGYFLYSLILNKLNPNAWVVVKRGGFFAGVFVLLSMFWLLPQFMSGGLGDNSILGRPLFGNHFWNILHAFSLHHPFWNSKEIVWFEVNKIPIYYWLIPFFAFLGLFLQRKNPKFIFFGFVTLLGVFLTKQVGNPLPDVYPWLYNNFPGFNAFREATKFYIYIILGYSILIAGLVDWIFTKSVKKIFSGIKYLLVFVIVILFLVNAKYLITGDIGTMFASKKIPDDYFIFKNFVLDQKEYFRTFWTPRDSRWSFYSTNHPRVGNVDVFSSLWRKLLQIGDYEDPNIKNLMGVFDKDYSNFFFDLASIKYVAVPIRTKQNDDDLFFYYGGRDDAEIRDKYVSALDEVPFLKKINIGTKEIEVFENKDFKPHIFSIADIFALDNTFNLEKKYDFVKEKFKKDFYFIVSPKNDAPNYLTKIINPFDRLTGQSIKNNKIEINFENGAREDLLWSNHSNQAGSVQFNKNANLKDETSVTLDNLNNIIYKNKDYNFENLIKNGSFEEGMWRDSVGDCNNFDDDPKIDMIQNSRDKSDGMFSLQLEATRHNACTQITVPVKGGSTYLLTFDYQSPNSDFASYFISYDDSQGDSIKELLKIENDDWHNYSKIIETPMDASNLTLFIYANSRDEITKIINRYDSFRLFNVPDLRNAFYFSTNLKNFSIPKRTIYKTLSPTKKSVHINSAKTPFFMVMGEAYHKGWRLYVKNTKSEQIDDEYHYNLNSFLNVWYIDINEICAEQKLCKQNSDGSYDMDFIIEFWPQKWFYFGLVISIFTAFASFVFLNLIFLKKLLKNNQ